MIKYLKEICECGGKIIINQADIKGDTVYGQCTKCNCFKRFLTEDIVDFLDKKCDNIMFYEG